MGFNGPSYFLHVRVLSRLKLKATISAVLDNWIADTVEQGPGGIISVWPANWNATRK
jgi:hypothetical protein